MNHLSFINRVSGKGPVRLAPSIVAEAWLFLYARYIQFVKWNMTVEATIVIMGLFTFRLDTVCEALEFSHMILLFSIISFNAPCSAEAIWRQEIGIPLVPARDLSPVRSRAITWSNININIDLLGIASADKNFREIWINMFTISFKKMHFEIWPAKYGPFCWGCNVITYKNTRNKKNHIVRFAIMIPLLCAYGGVEHIYRWLSLSPLELINRK